MLQRTPSTRTARLKRKEEFLGSMTKLIGCSALVIIVASVFYVMIEKMMRPIQADQAYIDSYDEDAGRSTWSGNKDSQPALMAARSSLPPPPIITRVTGAPGSEAAVPATGGLQNVEAKRPLIEEAVRNFFQAVTVHDKLAYVRDPDRVGPLMDEYHSRHPIVPQKWRALGWTLPVDEPGYNLGYVQATFEEAEPVSLIVEEMSNGGFRVDWESFVRYGELSWSDFLKIKPLQPKLFRVIASKAESAPVAPLGAEQDVLEIKHPAEDGTVFATLDRRDPQLAPLLQQLQVGKWKDVPLTLRLCYPGPAGDGMAVRIAGVEGKGWLILQHKRS